MTAQDPSYNAFRAAASKLLRTDSPSCFNPTPAAVTVLARDLQDLSDELDTSGYNGDVNNAMVVLLRRIGGRHNIPGYVNCLLAQSRAATV